MTLEFGAARENMVENQVRTNDVTDLAVQDAMRAVARDALVPADKAHLAYAEAAVEYAPGLCLLTPRDVAKLLQAVRPRPGQRALAIAAPYAALVLAHIGLSVRLRLPAGATVPGAATLAAAGVAPATAALDALDADGPYDVIVVEGAVAAVPAAWLEMLAPGGRLGVIARRGPVGHGLLYTRGADDAPPASRQLFDAAAPYLPGFQPVPAFAF